MACNPFTVAMPITVIPQMKGNVSTGLAPTRPPKSLNYSQLLWATSAFLHPPRRLKQLGRRSVKTSLFNLPGIIPLEFSSPFNVTHSVSKLTLSWPPRRDKTEGSDLSDGDRLQWSEPTVVYSYRIINPWHPNLNLFTYSDSCLLP